MVKIVDLLRHAFADAGRAFKSGPAPERSVIFGFWTAEERGLLGSEYYAADPIYLLDKTVANFDLDMLQTAGRSKDVVMVGKGQSTLEDDFARFAQAQRRTVSEESLPNAACSIERTISALPSVAYVEGRLRVQASARGKRRGEGRTSTSRVSVFLKSTCNKITRNSATQILCEQSQ